MKAVFVTGISRGIGLEIAKVFSKDGYHVYGSSRSNFDLNKALDTDNAAHFALDVNDRSSVNDIFNRSIYFSRYFPIFEVHAVFIGSFQYLVGYRIFVGQKLPRECFYLE